MTREEAIKHFEVQARCSCRPFSDAAKMAVSALRAQQTPAKLDRRGWEECPDCWLWEGLNNFFCPYCGRPLTEAAWAELERRINGGTTDKVD